MTTHNRITKLRKQIGFALLLTIGLCLFAEVSIRLVEAFYGIRISSPIHELLYRENYWVLRPKQQFVFPTRYGNIAYHTNQDGFRDEEHSPNSKAHKILFLGDSVTFGLSADYQSIFARQIENLLKKEKSLFPNGVQTINLAVFSYSGEQQIATLKRYGLRHKPNLIVLQMYMNDFYLRTQTKQTSPQLSFFQRFKRTIPAIILYTAIYSALFRRILQGVEMLGYQIFHDWKRANPQHLNAAEPQMYSNMFRTQPLKKIGGLDEVLKLRDIAQKYNIPFFVFLTPNEVQLFFDKYDTIDKTVESFFLRNNVHFASPLSVLRQHPQKKHLFLDGLHFSNLGHDVLATWLTPILRKKLLEKTTKTTLIPILQR